MILDGFTNTIINYLILKDKKMNHIDKFKLEISHLLNHDRVFEAVEQLNQYRAAHTENDKIVDDVCRYVQLEKPKNHQLFLDRVKQ